VKEMVINGKITFIAIFTLIVLILSIETTVLPWWEFSTNRKYETLKDTKISINYFLSGTVRATKISLGKQTLRLTINGPWNLTLEKVEIVTKEFVARIPIPSTKLLNVSIPKEIGLGTYESQFKGRANVTAIEISGGKLSVQLNGNVTIYEHEVPITFSVQVTAPNFPQKYLGTWLSASGNTTVTVEPIITSIMELGSNKEEESSLNSFLYTIWSSTFAGMGLDAAAFALTLLMILGVMKKNFLKYVRYISAIAAIIFISSFIYFLAVAPSLISKLSNVAPQEVCILEGKNVKSLFGTIGKEITYGPSSGWYFALTACLLNITLYALIKMVERVG
jgi:hypothetical protein